MTLYVYSTKAGVVKRATDDQNIHYIHRQLRKWSVAWVIFE